MLANDACELFRLFYEAYYKKNINHISKVHSAMDKLVYKKAYNLITKKNLKDGVVIYHLSEVVRNIHLACGPALGIIIQYID